MRYEFHCTCMTDHGIAYMVETLLDYSFERAKECFWRGRDQEDVTVLYALGSSPDEWSSCEEYFGPDECLPAAGDDPTEPLPKLGSGSRPDVDAAFLAVLVAGLLAGCACLAIARAS